MEGMLSSIQNKCLGFFPSQNSAWQNFLLFLSLLHFREIELYWSISHQVEAFVFAETTAAFPGHGRNFPFSCVLDFSTKSLMESCRCCGKCAATGKGRCSHWPLWDAHGELLLQQLVPCALLSLHFLLLIKFALIWVFGRRIKEK